MSLNIIINEWCPVDQHLFNFVVGLKILAEFQTQVEVALKRHTSWALG
jgi:hypothetical protein